MDSTIQAHDNTPYEHDDSSADELLSRALGEQFRPPAVPILEEDQLLERDFDVAIEFYDQCLAAKNEGRQPPKFENVEQEVDERRRRDRQEDTAG